MHDQLDSALGGRPRANGSVTHPSFSHRTPLLNVSNTCSVSAFQATYLSTVDCGRWCNSHHNHKNTRGVSDSGHATFAATKRVRGHVRVSRPTWSIENIVRFNVSPDSVAKQRRMAFHPTADVVKRSMAFASSAHVGGTATGADATRSMTQLRRALHVPLHTFVGRRTLSVRDQPRTWRV